MLCNRSYWGGGILPIAVVLASTGARAATVAQPPDLRLVHAAKGLDRAQVRDLLKQHVDVNQAEGDGMTALHWAVYNNDLEMAYMLLDAHASVKAVTRLEALTPPFMACIRGTGR
jgi:ankyrin repeat protein